MASNLSEAQPSPSVACRPRGLSPFRAASTIALRELTEQMSSFRFHIIALLAIAVTPLAVYVGSRDYANRLETWSRLSAAQQTLASGPAGTAIDLVETSPWIQSEKLLVLRTVRKPAPLSVIVHGLDGVLPQYWDYSPTGYIPGPAAWQPQRLADLLGRLDLEFLVRIVLGLLAVLLAFDAIVGEKELGTLRIVLSQPVARAAIFTGKLAGGILVLWIPLVTAFIVALLSSQVLGLNLAAAHLGKVGLLAIVSACYLACFYALGLFVSSTAKSQKTSLVVLLVAWVFTVLAVPPVATLVAHAVYPVAPAAILQDRKSALDEDIRREARRAMTAEFSSVATQRAYRERKEEMDRRFSAILLDALKRRRQLISEVDRDAERRLAQQKSIARAIMSLSPAMGFANTAADLAGTGDAHYAAWIEAVRRRQSELESAFFDDPPSMWIASYDPDAPGKFGVTTTIKRREPPSIADLPPFSPPQVDAAGALQRSFYSLAQLLISTGVFVCAGFAAFSRYDVR